MLTRLNRNILECKYESGDYVVTSARGLNRNILECKYYLGVSMGELRDVLIETYWNVNVLAELTALGLDAS